MNANWVAGGDGEDGSFAFQIITEDGERHAIKPSANAATALLSIVRPGAVLVWDPADRTLIAANLVGKMPWTEEH